MQSWGQGKLEPSADPEQVRAESWGHDPHLHFLYLSFPEPPPSTDSNMVIVAGLVVLGAVAIIGAVVAFVMKRRRNTGRKGQGLGFLSASFRSVLCPSMGNTATPHIATVSTWVCCQFWELPSVKIFLELSQLSFSQVDKEETMLQLQVSVGTGLSWGHWSEAGDGGSSGNP